MKVNAVSIAGIAGANKAINEDAIVHTDYQPCANMRFTKVIVYSPGFTTILIKDICNKLIKTNANDSCIR